MPNYVTKSLRKFQHPTQNRTQYAPHQWTRQNYGATKQLATPLDTSPPISEEQKLMIQKNWKIPLLCPRCGMHYATSPQRTS